jgi:Na+-driven multidrug efflux pump
MRVIAVTFCVTLAASLAARHGSTSMAAFQVCLQVWLAVSLLADGLAVAGQVSYNSLLSPLKHLAALSMYLSYLPMYPLLILGTIPSWFQAILAGAFANKDYEKATATASRVLQVFILKTCFFSMSIYVARK